MQVTSETTTHHFASIEDAKMFALAGNATMTLESLRSGVHFTFKIRECKDDANIHFVNLLRNGSADEGEFTYLGIIRNDKFTLTRNSRAGEDAPSVRAFRFFWNLRELHSALVIRHEGKCGRCGRTLTVPSSIDAGIGPDCAEIMGLDL